MLLDWKIQPSERNRDFLSHGGVTGRSAAGTQGKGHARKPDGNK